MIKHVMHSYVAVCILTLALFRLEADCRLHARHHFLHRRNKQTLKLPRTILSTYRVRSMESQTPSAQSVNSYPEEVRLPSSNKGSSLVNAGSPNDDSGLPPGNSGLPSGNAGLPSGNAGIPSGNAGIPSGNAGIPSGNARLLSGNAGLPPANIGSLPGNVGVPPGAAGLSPGTAELSPGAAGLLSGNTGLPPGSVGLPAGDGGLPPGSAGMPDGNGGLPHGNDKTPLQLPEFHSSLSNKNTSPVATFKPPQPDLLPTPDLYSNVKPRNTNLKRRKKNVQKKNGKSKKLNGKTLLEKSTANSALTKNGYLKRINDYLGTDDAVNNATLIPLPKGLQIKTASRQKGGNVNVIANITSSTQKLISFDNVTEIENVVEMQMEKKLEDDKGVNKGSEEVRIIETEHVRPVVKNKWRDLNLRKRRRKGYKKRFLAHHRSRRSKMNSEEMQRLNSVLNKAARRLLSKVRKIREGVVESNDFSKRRKPLLKGKALRNAINTTRRTKYYQVCDRDETDYFNKLFLKQIRKLKKSREIYNGTVSSKRLNAGQRWKNANHSARKITNVVKNYKFPELTSVSLKLDTTGNSTKDVPERSDMLKEIESEKTIFEVSPVNNALKKYIEMKTNLKYTIVSLKRKLAAITSMTEKSTLKLVYVGEEKGSEFVSFLEKIVLFSAVTFIIILLIRIMQRKFCRVIVSKTKSCSFYPDGQNEKGYARVKSVHVEDNPQLEWQSENGDWL